MITELRDVTIEDGSRVTITFADDKITAVGKPTGLSQVSVDCAGLEAYPAAIDTHVHWRGPTESHKETPSTCAAAARAGGVGTIFGMPNFKDRPITSCRRLEDEISRQSGLPVSYRIIFGTTDTNHGEVETAISDGALRRYLAGIKLYLEETTGDMVLHSLNIARRHCQIAAKYGVPVAVHVGRQAELDRHRADLLAKLGRPLVIGDHQRLRPSRMEEEGVLDALQLQRETGCALHICHLSSPTAMAYGLEAKAKGFDVSLETGPQYCTLDASKLLGISGGCYKVNPPLRHVDQMEQMAKLVCWDDVDLMIGSDHAPHTLAEKHHDDYDAVPSGLPGVQTSMILIYQFVAEGRMSRQRFVDITSRKAARRFGLASKGELAPGYDADIVIIDPNGWTIPYNRDMQSRCGWTPYHGMPLRGKIQFVYS